MLCSYDDNNDDVNHVDKNQVQAKSNRETTKTKKILASLNNEFVQTISTHKKIKMQPESSKPWGEKHTWSDMR